MYRIAVDTGGTFTDSLSIDEKGRLSIAKTPTIPDDLSAGVINALNALARNNGMNLREFLEQTSMVVLGTTVASNAILTGKGCKVGMIHTKGFRDIIEMRRVVRQDVYDMKKPPPTYIVPRYLRDGVEERLNFRGKVVIPLNEDDVRKAASELVNKHKVDSVMVFYLHSYINPSHERRTAEIIKKEFPDLDVVLSSDVLPRIGEFDRCNTTALAAYVSHEVSRFLRGLENRLKESGFKHNLMVMANNAGIQTVEACTRRPATLIGSGPAAGPVAAVYLAELMGEQNLVSVDMGGTTLDTSLIPKRRILTSADGKMVGDQKLSLNMVDVDSAAVGGGGIAWLDIGRILRIGPQSAGAVPGPACYGLGGEKPTVTDADVVLGFIPFDYFLGGEKMLNVELAKKAIERDVARPLGLNVFEAADLIYSLTNANIADQIRLACTRRGYDPKGWVLCVGGGAGATHALNVAKDLNISKVIIPKTAPVFCTLGMLNTDIRHDFIRTYYQDEKPVDEAIANQMYGEMIQEGLELLKMEDVPTAQQEIVKLGDVRYYGQINEVEAVMPGRPKDKLDFKSLVDNFHKRHFEIFGYSDPKFPTQVINFKVSAFGRIPVKPRLKEEVPGGKDPAPAHKRDREVYFKELGGFVRTPVYDGDRLAPGNIVLGPAIIEEKATTLVVPAKVEVEVDKYGNYIARL